jgi:hypothetical protein
LLILVFPFRRKFSTGQVSNELSNKKDTIEEVVKEREEAKRRILEQNPHIPKDALEFVLSLPIERKIPKVTELETVYATAKQQEEMERRLLNIKKTADSNNNTDQIGINFDNTLLL